VTPGSSMDKNQRSDDNALEMGAAGLSETSAMSTEVHSEVVTCSFRWLLGLVYRLHASRGCQCRSSDAKYDVTGDMTRQTA
jgi:hypothetical protein